MPDHTDWRSTGRTTHFFRVEQTPRGDADFDIRQQWVGLLLPMMSDGATPVPAVEVVSREPVTVERGIEVERYLAVLALERAGRLEARDYWQYECPDSVLVFDESEGTIIPAEELEYVED